MQKKIMQQFGGNYFKFGNSYYTDAETSILLIQFCEEHNLVIFGIETFKLHLGDKIGIQPNMEDDIYYSTDFPKKSDGNYNWDVAISFIINKKGKNLLFEVDFDSSVF